jgi:hypothetical protein
MKMIPAFSVEAGSQGVIANVPMVIDIDRHVAELARRSVSICLCRSLDIKVGREYRIAV